MAASGHAHVRLAGLAQGTLLADLGGELVVLKRHALVRTIGSRPPRA